MPPSSSTTRGRASSLSTCSRALSPPAEVDVALPGRTLFSMGCHAGLNVADVLIASPTAEEATKLQDWAQTYANKGAAAYAANTGFGYGDSAAVAMSEKLMLLF